MCKVYVTADPIIYESRTRALRIHGVVTTIRLENHFWNILQKIAEREHMTISQFAVKLYDELTALREEPPTNFASFLRVCCLRYLSLNMATDKPGLALLSDNGSASNRLNFHVRNHLRTVVSRQGR